MPRLSKIGAAALAAFGWTSGSSVTATYLVVAGGGGGGADEGGGGGGGGYQTSTLSLNPTLSYTVTVGAGGAGGVSGVSRGTSGSDSVFSSVTSTGGGGGGSNSDTINNGLNGGSGGGAASTTSASGASGTGGTGTAGQGNNGGSGYRTAGVSTAGGGGGGASAVGANASSGVGGNGGAGSTSSISGTSTGYAGGGGGGCRSTAGTATQGGGAGSTSGNASNGTSNLGGGGGGGRVNGGQGGSGIVIISYSGSQQFSGGVVTSSGGNTIHTFTTSGTLGPITTLSASYLIVAGGGAGGGTTSAQQYSGGGGGAGGLLSGSGLTIDPNSTYLVTVGAGGAGTTAAPTAGTNSTFSMVATAAVAGGGGGYNGGNGSNGGSGGGGGGNVPTKTGGTGTAGQGYDGGTGGVSTNFVYGGGGGGGAGGIGGNATGSGAGNGGVGVASSISGTSTYYAGGGGGGAYAVAAGTGGNGGGGAGGLNANGTSGTANTGGGGGGCGENSTYSGGNGGSGVVIISYPGSTQQMAGGIVTIVGGNVIHTFTSTGYLAPLKYVGNSLRFRSSASAYLSRTFGTATSTTQGTFSFWLKRGNLSASYSYLWSASNYDLAYFDSSGTLWVAYLSNLGYVSTNAVFRDPAAWYHIVITFDTPNATAADRLRVYVNGVQQTLNWGATPQTQNATWQRWNVSGYTGDIGDFQYNHTNGFDGYYAEWYFIDGQALAPTSFGTFNSYGVWQPITYGGSYGKNGFYLPFNAQTSSYAGSFNGSNQYLSSTVGSSTIGSGDFTVEFYINSTSGTDARVFSLGNNNATGSLHIIYTGTYMRVNWATTGGATGTRQVSGGGWHHYALVRSSNTLKSYVDGVLDVNYGTVTDNFNLTALQIAANSALPSYFAGYLSNFRITTSALYTANFTPPTSALSAVSGTTYLTLQNASIVDNSTNAYSITNNNGVSTGQTYPFAYGIFNDQGPAGNNWTPNNVSGVFGSTLDYMTDVPTLTSATAANYATFNPLTGGSSTTSDGNLAATFAPINGARVSTIAVTSGKWYAEFVYTSIVGYAVIGIGAPYSKGWTTTQESNANCVVKYSHTNGGTAVGSWTMPTSSLNFTYTTGNVIGIALDMTTNTVTFYKDGVNVGNFTFTVGAGGSPSDVCFLMGNSDASSNGAGYANFGQRPFTYTPPSGFVALNTFNL